MGLKQCHRIRYTQTYTRTITYTTHVHAYCTILGTPGTIGIASEARRDGEKGRLGAGGGCLHRRIADRRACQRGEAGRHGPCLRLYTPSP